MAGESTTTRRAELGKRAAAIQDADSKNDLISEIRGALEVLAPMGDPETIEDAATAYRKAADHVDEDVIRRLTEVEKDRLPNSWTGTTAFTATDAVGAARRAADQMCVAFRGGAAALFRLSSAVADARKQDEQGRSQLREALSILGSEDGFFDSWVENDEEEAAKNRAKSFAKEGSTSMHAAAVAVDDAARAAARDLNKLASEARSGHIDARGMSAVDKLMLADATTVSEQDPAREQNEILTAGDLERSSDRLNRMSPSDRAEFDRMLAQSRSPEERAYLTKALAAGHDMDDIRTFREKIHGHGDDEAWLRDHLTPVVAPGDTTNSKTENAGFMGQGWTQGGDGTEGTCVASSTVTARAMVDPVYALGLTGGESGQENDPEAFRDRLVDEQHRVHDEGDGGYSGWFGTGDPEGMDTDGQSEIIDKEISPHTGAEYDFRDVGSADARRDALPEIEQAVAEGRPVPVNVKGDDSAHAMMIVGQEGDMLQIYNPWGTTTWVSEDDFVNGGMAKASDNRLPDTYEVHIPR